MGHLKKSAITGHLLKNASGHLVKNCLPSSCPCDATEWAALVASGTPCHGLVDCYRIALYNDGDVSACPTCVVSADPAWDGTMDVHPTTECSWETTGVLSIDGKDFGKAFVRLWLSAWLLSITCGDGAAQVEMWAGEKSTGSTPVGVYTRASGCAGTPSTLEIEECP